MNELRICNSKSLQGIIVKCKNSSFFDRFLMLMVLMLLWKGYNNGLSRVRTDVAFYCSIVDKEIVIACAIKT